MLLKPKPPLFVSPPHLSPYPLFLPASPSLPSSYSPNPSFVAPPPTYAVGAILHRTRSPTPRLHSFCQYRASQSQREPRATSHSEYADPRHRVSFSHAHPR